MKKKLIQILMLLVATVSVGAFVSCKDTNEDMYNDLRTQTATALSENASLRSALQEWVIKLQEQITKYEALEATLSTINTCNCDPNAITNLTNEVSTINGKITNITADMTEVKSNISGMEDDISDLKNNINAQLVTITKLIGDLSNLQGQVGTNTSDIADLTDLINSLTQQVTANKTLLETLTNLPADVASQQVLISTLQAEIANLKAWQATVNGCNCGDYTEVLTLLSKLQQEMTDAKDKVDAAIANATNIATAAQTAANEAQTTATAAQGAANTAKAIADAAATAAQNALDFAKTVEQKADQAGLDAATAKEAADKAWELATQALVAANTANGLATQVAALAETVGANSADIESNKAAIAALQTSTETIRTLIENNKNELLQKINELTSRLSADESAYNAKFAENAQKILTNAQNIATNAQNIEKNVQAIAKAEQDISNLSSQISAMNAKIGAMENDILKAFTEASNASATATANSLEIAALKAIIENLQKDVETLQNNSGSGSTSPVSEEDFQSLKETVQGLSTSITTLNQELTGKISGNTTEIEKLKTALENLQTAAGNTQTALESLTTKVNELEVKLATMEIDAETLRAYSDANLAQAKLYADLQIANLKNEIISQVQEMLKDYLKSGDIDLSNYVTKEEVANFVAKEELANYALKDDLANLVSQDVLNALIDGLNDKLNGTKSELEAALQVAISNLTKEMLNKFESLNGTLSDFQKRISQNETDIEWLKTLYNTLDGKTSNLETWKEQIEIWKTQIETWKANLPETATPAEIYEAIKEQITEQITQELNSQLTTIKEEIKSEIQTGLTEDEVKTLINTYNFVTQDQISGLAQALIDLADLKTKVDGLPDYGDRITALETATAGLAGLIAKVNTIESTYAKKEDLADFLKTADVLQLLSDYAKTEDFNSFKQQILDALEGYATTEKITQIETKITELETKLNNINLDDYASKQELQDLKTEINTQIAETLKGYVTNEKLTEYLANYVTNDKLNDYVTKDKLTEELSGYATVGALNTLSDELNEKYTELKNKFNDYLTTSAFNAEKDELLSKINANTTSINEIKSELTTINSKLDTMQGEIDALTTRVKDAEDRLDALEDKLEEEVGKLRTDIQTIQDNLAKQVTSIIVQGTHNPWFGTFNIPASIQSNILLAFFGLPLNDIEFPTYQTAPYGVRASQAFTQDEITMLKDMGLQIFEAPANLPLLNEDGKAGKVYMTINPNTADLSGLKVKIVNTQDKESPVELSPIRKCNETLMFGYSRADNGFYVADAFVTPATVMTRDNGLPLNKEDIKTMFKDVQNMLTQIAKDAKSGNGNYDLGQIASDVYTVIRGLRMERKGLKCTYTTTDADGNEQDHSVYSEYNLATTFLTPLNLNTAKDFNYVTMPGYEFAENLINRLAKKVKDRVHGVFDNINNAKIVDMILNFQIKNIEAPNLPENLVYYPTGPDDPNQDCGKFYLKMDTTFVMEGISYFLQIPVDAQRVPVKFANDLVVDGVAVTVPAAEAVNVRPFRNDYNQETEGKPTELISLTKPTVVVWNNEETGNVETILVVPVKNHEGSIKGYLDIDMTATIATTTPAGAIHLDDHDVATISGGVLTPTTTQYVDMTEVYYSGTTDSRTFVLTFHYDMRDAATDLWGLAQDALGDVNNLLDDIRDIIKEANNVLDQINNYEGKINSTIDNIVDNYLMKYLNKVNSLVVNFVNATNRRFQPFMAASTSKGLKRVSVSKDYPTVLSSDVELYPTSKTMELFVPMARKHIAVTNVFKGSASAQGGNSDCMAKLRAANSADKFNEVLDGTVRHISANGTMVSGYTYEIAYSVLDFEGNMATHRYYIKIQ